MDDLKAELAALLEEQASVDLDPERAEEIAARIDEIRAERAADTLTFPPKSVNEQQLRAEIAAACTIPAPYVDSYPDRLEVVGMVDDAMRAKIQATIDSHVPVYPLSRSDKVTVAAERVAALQNGPTKAALQAILDVIS